MRNFSSKFFNLICFQCLDWLTWVFSVSLLKLLWKILKLNASICRCTCCMYTPCCLYTVDKSDMELYHTLFVSPWRQSCIIINGYLFSNHVSIEIYIPLTLQLELFCNARTCIQNSNQLSPICHVHGNYKNIQKLIKYPHW